MILEYRKKIDLEILLSNLYTINNVLVCVHKTIEARLIRNFAQQIKYILN